MFNNYFSKNKVKILKRDFPLVGYESVDAIRDRKDSWFFLMETPLQNHKIKDKQEWIDHVFRRKEKTITDLQIIIVINIENEVCSTLEASLVNLEKILKEF